MGWKGATRSIIATYNRSTREAERKRKRQEKIAQLEHAAHSARESENLLRSLVSIHLKCSEKIDWNEVLNRPEPQKPERSDKLEERARSKYENFKPNFFHKLLKIEEWRKKSLEKNIAKAAKKDDHEHALRLNQYGSDHKEWAKNSGLAKRVLKNDLKAFSEVIKEFDPLGKDSHISDNISFDLVGDTLVAKTAVFSQDIIPQEKYLLRQSGTLSAKQIPKGEFYDLYQDYVCSCSLRVAREVFALLPVDKVVVDATDSLLNKSTGHKENQVILSVLFVRDTLEELNLRTIDPSSAMRNFVHNIDFKKSSGFEAVASIGDVKSPNSSKSKNR
jgi:hypothetical protein